MKGRVGIGISLMVLLAWAVDRMTQSLSIALGKLLCGESYMKPVDGTVGDLSCGFDADIYLSLFLIIVLTFGIVLYVSSVKKVKA